jgi:hypothetical protein
MALDAGIKGQQRSANKAQAREDALQGAKDWLASLGGSAENVRCRRVQ